MEACILLAGGLILARDSMFDQRIPYPEPSGSGTGTGMVYVRMLKIYVSAQP